jgi:hypothetical protein
MTNTFDIIRSVAPGNEVRVEVNRSHQGNNKKITGNKMSSKTRMVVLYLFAFSLSSFGQNNSVGGYQLSSRITVSEQSYLERSYYNSIYHDVEKSAGICAAFTFELKQNIRIDDNFMFDYGLGVTEVKQNYTYSELSSSSLENLDMGLSTVNAMYICSAARFLYKGKKDKVFYLKPFIGLGVSLLYSKYEKVQAVKSGFNDVIDPGFRFNRIFPEASMGFLLSINPRNWRYEFMIGPSVSNNLKYYKESTGVLFSPIALSINFAVCLKSIY